MEHSNNMLDVYKNIENYNPNTKRKILTVFGDMSAKRLNSTHFLLRKFQIKENFIKLC